VKCWAKYRQTLLGCRTFPATSKPSFIPSFSIASVNFSSEHPKRIGSHFSRQLEAIRIHVCNYDVTRAGRLQSECHTTDRPRAVTSTSSPTKIERESSVHGMPKGSNRKARRAGWTIACTVVLWNAQIQATPDIHAHACVFGQRCRRPAKQFDNVHTYVSSPTTDRLLQIFHISPT